jgi:hypothetical protein
MSSATKSVPQVKPKMDVKTGGSIVTKLVPFICAGAAVGVSILALKELKKIKNEMLLVKNKQNTVVPNNVVKPDPEMVKKMDRFELEFKKINEYLMNNNSKNPKIIKNVLKQEPLKEIKIINEPVKESVKIIEPESDVEYEEVEVTDDEEES